MKLHDIVEEMGIFAMDRIRKNFLQLVKKLGLQIRDWDVKQQGSIYAIFKRGKLFARVPSSRIMQDEYLTDVLKKAL